MNDKELDKVLAEMEREFAKEGRGRVENTVAAKESQTETEAQLARELERELADMFSGRVSRKRRAK